MSCGPSDAPARSVVEAEAWRSSGVISGGGVGRVGRGTGAVGGAVGADGPGAARSSAERGPRGGAERARVLRRDSDIVQSRTGLLG